MLDLATNGAIDGLRFTGLNGLVGCMGLEEKVSGYYMHGTLCHIWTDAKIKILGFCRSQTEYRLARFGN
jgi:hypothetical protein